MEHQDALQNYLSIQTYQGSSEFVESHLAELSTNETYDFFQKEISNSGNNEFRHELLEVKKYDVIDFLTYKFLVAKWPDKREILIRGYKWLLDPAAQEQFEALVAHNPAYEKSFRYYWNEVVLPCNENNISRIIAEGDMRIMVLESAKALGWEKINYLQQAIKLAEFIDKNIWAQLQTELGHTFSKLESTNHTDHVLLAIEAYEAALTVHSFSDFPKEWANLRHHLGLTLRKYTLGSKAENIEKAIVCYKDALQIYLKENYPEKWADLQNCLGNALCERIVGTKVENIENAIEAYKKALTVYTENEIPEEWARTKNNIGTAYAERILGNKRQNMEDAINAFLESLRIRTKENYPYDWAFSLDNLGNSYLNRIDGDRSENIEKSIAAYQQALEVRTLKDYPAERAFTLSHLCGIYAQRMKGDQAKNIEYAIKAGEEALEIYKIETFPMGWAGVHLNLATAYRSRLRGDPKENIDKAINYIFLSMKVFSKSTFPEQWAHNQTILATLYSEREKIVLDKTPDIEASIEAHRRALEIYTIEHYPFEYALAQMHLGNSLRRQSGDGKLTKIKDAIKAQQNALKVLTKESHPFQWGIVQTNLGAAYIDYIDIEGVKFSELAEQTLLKALDIFTIESFPDYYKTTNENLGELYRKLNQWAKAIEHYERAHEAAELQRHNFINNESRQKVSNKTFVLYAKLIECCINDLNVQKAAYYTMITKSRTLAEQLYGEKQSLNELLASSPELSKAYEPVLKKQTELRELMAKVEYHQSISPHYTPSDLSKVKILNQQINNLIDDILFQFPSLTAVKSIPPLSLYEAQTLLEEIGNVTLIEFVHHTGGWGAFLINSSSVNYVHFVPDLIDRLAIHLSRLIDGTFWLQDDWAKLLSEMHDLLILPLKKYLPKNGQLILAPTHFLHLIPFQAMMDEGQYMIEKYSFNFIPSIATLKILNEQIKKRNSLPEDASSVLCIAHSGYKENFLQHVIPEADFVKSQFLRSECLYEDEATVDNVILKTNCNVYQVLHFSCHGFYDFNHPVQSGLLLAKERILTINDVRLNIMMKGHPLVTLSACQTGKIMPQLADESIGLSWTFLTAGASAVLSSQWSVNDGSTRQLFEHFYKIRRRPRTTEGEALRLAMLKMVQQEYFNKPFYWASFQLMGLPMYKKRQT